LIESTRAWRCRLAVLANSRLFRDKNYQGFGAVLRQLVP
jgi:hypothetical protein